MTDGPAPLALPTADGYAAWLAERCEHHLGRVRELVTEFRGLTDAPALEVVEAWNAVNLALGNVFSAASLLANVHPDEAVRTQAEDAEQDAHRLLTELSLDRSVYDVLAGVDADSLDRRAARMLEKSLLDFRRSGVDRDDETRERLRHLAERQTEVGQTFSKNIRDGVGRLRVAPDRLAGLPADFVEARTPGDDGLVELTTEYPDYVPVMTFATDRELRREMLTAFLNRAWPHNDGVLTELLELGRETAGILGYVDWPSYDAEVKMISTGLNPRTGGGPAIPAFIERVTELAATSAERDFAVLLERLRRDRPDAVGVDGVDKAFYSEVVRRERFDVDAQEVRRYFDFTKVRRGLLEVTGRLFGLEYVERPDVPRWHDDVTAYDVVGELGGAGAPGLLGRIYLDLHPRAGKYSHAAQFDLVTGVAGTQLPEGVLVCNFPTGLMEHDQVVTLFHEFGHLVHHVLGGQQEWARFSGVATEWDFVEAPSQMLEEWAWDHSVLATFATDGSGEAIPAELVERMRTAEEFGKGFLARTQMFYAAVSYRLHAEVPGDITAAVRELQGRYDLFGYVPETHFHASFGHLGGYTSAYYTYMWSLVIAKDLFSAFDREDLFATEVAHRYRDRVLAPGGSADAAELVADFLGRPYGFDAFERWLCVLTPVQVSVADDDLSVLVSRVEERLGHGRFLLGLAGPPGAGKSTLALALVERLRCRSVVVPLDGFHLADVELERQCLLGRKGAPETFDGWGYAALLERLKARPDHVVHAPGFERVLEQPLAGAVPVPPDADVVVTEGNYLLLDRPEWRAARECLDEVWYVEVHEPLRLERLVARHVAFGKTEEDARSWVEQVDGPNAALVAASRGRAELVVDLAGWPGQR